MKNTVSIPTLALALMGLLLTSCNLIDKADDISFNTTLDQTFSVDESTAAENKSYDESLTLDATTDTEIEKYKTKIKAMEVTKATYKIENFVGDDIVLSNAKVSFGDSDGSAPTVVATIGTLNLHDAYSSGSEYELTISKSDTDKLNAFLKGDKKLKIYLEGTLSSTPVAFDAKVKFDIKVTANAL